MSQYRSRSTVALRGESQPGSLREAIASAPRNARGRRMYSPELRCRVVEYAQEVLEQGRTQTEISTQLGLHQAVLSEWLRAEKEPSAPQTHVAHTETAGATVLVFPDGTRVEGLKPAEILEILRGLGRGSATTTTAV